MIGTVETEESPFETFGWKPAPFYLPETPRTRSQTILLVDDDSIIRSLAKITLATNGYEVILAEEGSEALEIIRSRRNHIDLLILDLVMPGMSGPATLMELLREQRQVDVLLSSAIPLRCW